MATRCAFSGRPREWSRGACGFARRRRSPCSMQALADLADGYSRLRRRVDPLIEQLTKSGTPRSRVHTLARRAALRRRLA